jgi:hypothetical protein
VTEPRKEKPDSAPPAKKPYHPPELLALGTLREITGKSLGPSDGKAGKGSFLE